jgi:uncharacterized SAM-binding protein YcdF (DUF218 family)
LDSLDRKTTPAAPGKRVGEDADSVGNRVGASVRKPGKRGFLGSRRRKLLAVVAVLVVVFAVATVRLFVRPDQGMPAQVSAIVMLNGPGDRLGTTLDLARQHRAPFVVISRGSPAFGHGSDCAPHIPREKIICFDPNPSTTKGEAEFVGRLARQYRWRSLVLVTSTPQDSRARLRVERCFAGPVYVVTVSLPLSSWPYEIAYEWAATVKAVVFQRTC